LEEREYGQGKAEWFRQFTSAALAIQLVVYIKGNELITQTRTNLKFMFLLNLNYSKSCLLAAFMQRFVFDVSCIYFFHATVACKIKKNKNRQDDISSTLQ